MADDIELKDFDYKDFANNLASQASEAFPQDIQGDDKKFVIDIISRYCIVAGDALVKEQNSKLSASQACLIIQFIAEWIYHKAIDTIRGGIEPKFREGILNAVAFTVFEIARKAVEKDFPQEQLITLVENHVKKSYAAELEKLASRGLITPEIANNTMNQSNIDMMAAEQVEDETQTDIAVMPDAKIIKLASLAILMRNFSPERMKIILQKFNKPERDVLINYLKMPDLEEKLDINAAMKCFEEMKNALPEVAVVSYDRAYKKMYKIVKNSSKDEIMSIIEQERPAVREYVLSCYQKKKRKIPAHIADVVSKYLEENVS